MSLNFSNIDVFELSVPFLIMYAAALIWKKEKISTVFFKLALGLYLILLINVAFFPMEIISWKDAEALEMATRDNNFIPFKTIAEEVAAILNGEFYQLKLFFGNLAMLTPLGLFFTAKYESLKERLVKVTLVAVLIETLQFTIGMLIGYNYRSVDIDDFILNACGGIISCLICHWIYKKWQNRNKKQTIETTEK